MGLPDFDPQHAAYIWAVYGLAGILIPAMIAITCLRASRAKKMLEDIQPANEKAADT